MKNPRFYEHQLCFLLIPKINDTVKHEGEYFYELEALSGINRNAVLFYMKVYAFAVNVLLLLGGEPRYHSQRVQLKVVLT